VRPLLPRTGVCMEWNGSESEFERGYWKSGEESSKEMEVLDASKGEEVTDGIIEVYGF
jgi:protein SMG6